MKRTLVYVLCLVLFFLKSSQSMPPSSVAKRILVTGGNKGIGLAICQRLLTEWSDTYVILTARNIQRGQQAVKDVVDSCGGGTKDRIEFLQLDTASDESVAVAAKALEKQEQPLYAIINNAGIGFDNPLKDTVNTNYFGPRRVNDAFGKLLKRPGGRIVHVSSASGPYFVQDSLKANPEMTTKLTRPWTLPNGIADIDECAKTFQPSDAYGFSKALLNAYTVLCARTDKDIVVNACTPGYILTDMTRNAGATNPPSKGAVPPCFLAMDESFTVGKPSGRYYGSDCVRSPLDRYRGPGDAPYENDEDLVS